MKKKQLNKYHLTFKWYSNMQYVIVIILLSILSVSATGYMDPGKQTALNPARQDQTDKMVPFTMKWDHSTTSKLDLSFMLEKPAGRDGYIAIKDGRLIKPSGERFKIWGVNITGGACFPEKVDAPKVAAYLARLGINAVRLHFMDSNWGQDRSLLNYELSNTRELYPPQLDRLDFFISELKKAGIYIDINLNVGRTYRKDDGVPEYEYMGVGKAVTLFDDHIIELEKEYAKQLLTHFNPYTGLQLKNDPAVFIVELVNENSLVEAWFNNYLLGKNTSTGGRDTWRDIPTYYGNELTVKYNKWLRSNLDASKVTAIEKEAGVKTGEQVTRLSKTEFRQASELRFHSEARFIISTERAFYTGMSDYLKKELQVKSLVIFNSDHNHSNSSYALLSNLSLSDVVDSHVYWNLNRSRIDTVTGKPIGPFGGSVAMIGDPGHSNVVQLSRSAIEGKPFTVSETNHLIPEFSCEGVPALGAYSLLQDWDGIFFYTFEHEKPSVWYTEVPNTSSLNLAIDPVKIPQIAAFGLMFMRNDLKQASTCVYRGYNEKQIIEGIRNPGQGPYYTEGFSPLIPLIKKTRIRSFTESIMDFPTVADQTEIKAETGEVIWHNTEKSFIEMAAPKTESLVGFMSGAPSLLSHMNARIENKFAAVTLISLDNLPVASSGKLLLVAAGKTGYSGTKKIDDGNRTYERGTKPTTIEVIKGEIELKGLNKAKSITFEPLDGAGNPLKSVTVAVKQGTAKLVIGNDVTVWYYLTVMR